MPDEIYIITGEVNSGKSSWLLKNIAGLRDAFGVIAEGIFIDSRKVGFVAIDIHSNQLMELARSDRKLDGFVIGRYSFSAAAFDFAKSAISKGIGEHILVIDEIGKLELEGKGYTDLLHKALSSDTKKLFITIRKPLLGRVIEYFKITEPVIIDINGTETA